MARARIRLTPQLLRLLLNMPDTYELHAAIVPDSEQGTVVLLVDAPDLPANVVPPPEQALAAYNDRRPAAEIEVQWTREYRENGDTWQTIQLMPRKSDAPFASFPPS